MEEYHTGWAARAAQELDEQILSSGIEPVRLKCKNLLILVAWSRIFFLFDFDAY